jgi:glucose-6-phosphate 1-epimerase
MTIDQLNQRFALENLARIESGQGRLPRISITTPAAEAHIYLHGAHVTHYQAKNQRPVLFVSSTSFFEPGKPIRGGVPICFPWFAERAGDSLAPMHGFARTSTWQLQSISRNGDEVQAALSLHSSETTRAQWPHEFEAVLRVAVGAQLRMELQIANTGTKPFTFEEALHSYFAVGDVRQVAVTGLAGAAFIDKNAGGQTRIIGDDPIRFQEPFDALVENTTATCTIADRLLGRRIVVAKEHSQTTVVWNPGSHGKQFNDLPDNERHDFVCIETANARGNAVTLGPGEKHVMIARAGIE